MKAPDDFDFPAGSKLWVLRTDGFDRHGDPIGGYKDSHQIGPCSVLRRDAGRETDRQERTTTRITVTCLNPAADVRRTDRIRLPNGRIADVVSDPYTPENPFTGWSPILRFTLEKVS